MTHYMDMWAIGLFPEEWVINRLLLDNQADTHKIVEYNETTTLVAISKDTIEIRLDKEGKIIYVY